MSAIFCFKCLFFFQIFGRILFPGDRLIRVVVGSEGGREEEWEWE